MKTFTKKNLLILSGLFLMLIIGVIFYQNNNLKYTAKATPLNYSGSTILKEFNQTDTDKYQTAAGTYDIATMASNVTSTLVSAFSNTTTKSLPLVANWNTGIPEFQNGLNPMDMINKLANGEHVLPSWKLDPYYNDNIIQSYYEASIKKAAELGLPLVFILPSPESALTNDDVYFTMNKENNPNVITTSGTILSKLSPLSPNSLWYEVGGQWSTTSLMAQIQEWYPNPPLILFVDEDESAKLTWSELSNSSRYSSEYPIDKSDEFKKTLVNAKWIEKYRQLHKGFREGFTKIAWKNNVKFVSRNQLATNMGETPDWANNATTTNLHANIWPYTTDALAVDFDLDGNKTDSSQNAPHITANNLPFMLEEAKIINPNFNYQLSINADNKITNPQRYRGYTQFVLWFLRPSVIRQETAATSKEDMSPLFQEVIDSVELVNYNDLLADFWKNGKLVETGASPFNKNVPTQYNTIPRWFLLKTDAQRTLWAFALVKGEVPNRQWLIFAQSPEENLTNINATIPEYKDILLDTTQKGSFYTLNESNNTNMLIQKLSAQSLAVTDDINSTYSNMKNPFINIQSLYESKFKNSPIEGHRTIYYISNDGNDSNDGLSPKTAWNTLKKVESSTFEPGDSILFKRGDKFYGQLTKWKRLKGEINNPITLGAFGEGQQPIITGMKKQILNWELYSDNIWKTSLSYNPERILINGTEILRADDLTRLNSKKYRWYYDNTDKYLYIYSEKKLDNLDIQFSDISNVLLLQHTQEYINIQDIDIQGGHSNTLYIYEGHEINIRNCTIGKFGHNGVNLTGTVYRDTYNILIDNNVIDSNFKFNYDDSKSSEKGAQEGITLYKNNHNIKIQNNLLKNWGHTNLIIGANIFKDKGYKVYDIVVNNNYITSPDISYGGRVDFEGNAYKIDFKYNIMRDIAVQNQFEGHDNHIHHNIIDTVKNTPLKPHPEGIGIYLQSYAGPVYNNVIEYNTILNCERSTIEISANLKYGDVYNNKIQKNIFLNSGTNELIINKPSIEEDQKGIEYNNQVLDNVFYSDKTSNVINYYRQNISVDDYHNELNITTNKNIFLNPNIDTKNGIYMPLSESIRTKYGAI